MGRAVSAGWVEIKEGMMGQIVQLKDKEAGKELEALVSLLKKGIERGERPARRREDSVADLVKRGLVERKETKTVSVTITDDGYGGPEVRRGPGLREAHARDPLVDQGDRARREAQADRRDRERPGVPPGPEAPREGAHRGGEGGLSLDGVQGDSRAMRSSPRSGTSTRSSPRRTIPRASCRTPST